jgi:hypothetical protein
VALCTDKWGYIIRVGYQVGGHRFGSIETMLRRIKFVFEITKQMVMYDKFKNPRKSIKKRYRSVVFSTGFIALLIHRHNYRLLLLVREVFLRYTKIKVELEYRH